MIVNPPPHPIYHVVCYSGGHSSAIVAIEVARRYGISRLVLLNHDINPRVEDSDIKRFKTEISAYLRTPIVYANMAGWDTKDQFDVVMSEMAFKVGSGPALCTSRLKTRPFEKYLRENYPKQNCILYYGFDKGEGRRIQRRYSYLSELGYRTAFPLAHWTPTITSTREIGVEPPGTYSRFKHANCIGCLKAGRQHWYVVYCTRPDIWMRGKEAEAVIGYTIINGVSLAELEPMFERMKCAGVEATEQVPSSKFWAFVRSLGIALQDQPDQRPCECVI